MPRFIFYDRRKKRWKKIGRLIKDFISLLILALFFILFAVIYKPTFSESLEKRLSLSSKSIIDNISTRSEESIDVKGEGLYVDIKKNSDGEIELYRSSIASEKKAMLTFDDGPDPVYTPMILDILKQENVKATFFLVGEQMVRHPQIVKRIVAEGHDIGVHTFGHIPEDKNLYPIMDNLNYEFDFTQKIIQVQTGLTTQLFRVPNWGAEESISMNTLIFTIGALDRGYKVASSTVDSLDWQESDVAKIVGNSVDTSKSQVILLHDGGGKRENTINALPEIIEQYKLDGFGFVGASDVAERQNLIYNTSIFERVMAYVTYYVYWTKLNFYKILKIIFTFSLVVVAISVFFTLLFATIDAILKSRRKFKGEVFFYTVSALVPAYNEENTIEKTVETLLSSEYPNFEVIVIDNNSTDKTVDRLQRFKADSRFRLVKESIQGKYAALNCGIKSAKGEILVVVDADTQVKPDALLKLVKPFVNPKVGAVSGYLTVGNIINPLTCFQAIEYIVSFNIERRAYNAFSAIPVIPGALGAWRKSVVKKVGGYKADTLTEDADLSIRIQKAGFKSIFYSDANALTEAPENVADFIKQRKRWTFGILQVLYKHRRMYFKEKYGILGLLILPYMALVQLPFMLTSPLVDIITIFSIVYFSNYVFLYFLLFLLLNTLLTFTAFVIVKEKRVWLLVFLPFMRIFYQLFWYYVLYHSIISILKGEFIAWRKLHHVGSVKLGYGLEADVVSADVQAFKKKT